VLLIAVLVLVNWFGSSDAMAAAYGIAVNGTMVVTCVLALIVVHKVWGWSLAATVFVIVPFLLIDVAFLVANLFKVAQGGWVPLALGGVIVVAMYTWRRRQRPVPAGYAVPNTH
jgi:KUP system potassium uptake protein